MKRRREKGGASPKDEVVTMVKLLVRWIVAKVIEFYKREDWKPERDSIPEGKLAKVLMFPNTTSNNPDRQGGDSAYWPSLGS